MSDQHEHSLISLCWGVQGTTTPNEFETPLCHFLVMSPWAPWCLILCQLAWTTKSPDVQFNIILGVSVRVSLDEINIWVSRLSEAQGFPQGEGATTNPLKAWTEQKDREREKSLSLRLSTVDTLVPSCLQTWTQTGTYTISSAVLRPLHSDQSYNIGSPGSPACQPQIFELLNLHNPMSQFLIINILPELPQLMMELYPIHPL